ncbi:MAG: efflux RND transporter periplasmic adaptor subunit, partial [Alkalimonas sp.]|nr:efflux RND transporter periplasmic adaptor subunit [Alkalimonas sp.]
MNKLLFVSALFTAGLVLTGCNQAQSSPNKASAEDIAIPVEVAISRHGEISSSYRTTTTLAATEEADLISKASGVIEKILVEE